MIIRAIKDTEVAMFNEVSSSAFIWKVDKTDKKLPYGIALGAFDDDDSFLMSALECIPFTCFFEKGTLSCVGIGGVASRPECRRYGCVRELFGKVFSMSEENGWDFSLLAPFSTSYYRQFGYETVLRHLNAEIEFSVLSRFDRCSDVELIREDNVSMLIKLYNDIAGLTNLLVRRSSADDFYCKPFTQCEYTYVFKKDGVPRGFVSYNIDRADSRVIVREIYFYDREALIGLLGFLRTFDGNMKYLEFAKLPLGSPILDVIGEGRGSKVTLFNGDSGRILNMTNVLRAKEYPREHGHFSFLSQDDIPACSGIFDIEYENGSCNITRRTNGEYDLSVSPFAAARIFLGSEGITEYTLSFMTGFEKKRDLTDFIRAFPRRQTDFNKSF